MAAPPGAEVALHYDHGPHRPPDVDDALVTGTGRAYLVLTARPVRRGPNIGTRVHLRCLVFAHHRDLPRGTVMHPLRWYAR